MEKVCMLTLSGEPSNESKAKQKDFPDSKRKGTQKRTKSQTRVKKEERLSLLGREPEA